MTRRRTSKGSGGGLVVVIVYLVWGGFFHHFSSESLLFAVLAGLAIAGFLVASLFGALSARAPWAGFSGVYARYPIAITCALGMAGVGVWSGRDKAAKQVEAERQAAEKRAADEAERARQEAARKAEEARQQAELARFNAISPATHIEAARAAMASGYIERTRTGGQLDESERHLKAIPQGMPESQEASHLLQEVMARRGREHLGAARSALASGDLAGAEQHLAMISADAREEAAAAVKLQKQIEAKKKDEARRIAREEARRQREEARRQRAEQMANRGLRCCDGSLSPSCSCYGSHRGCCSRHGGVCGCE